MNRPAEVREPPTGLERALLRASVWLYRARLGWLLGSRVMLIEHVGRRTGRIRHTVVEVVTRDRADDSYVVASGFGATAQWYRNLIAHPTAAIRVGRRRVRVDAVSLTAAEGGQVMADYAARHPRAARRLCRYLGYPVGGNGDDHYRAAGQHIPFLRLSVVNTPVPQAEEPAAYDLPEPDPRKDTHTVRLADGRALAYAQLG